MHRFSFILGPDDLIGPHEQRLLAVLQRRMPAPHTVRCRSGDMIALMVSHAPLPGPAGTRRTRRAISGPWPEPLSVRVEIDDDPRRARWCIESDHLGLHPIYHGCDRRGQLIASTQPDLVAALIESTMSIHSLAEQLLVGYNLGDHTPFESVHRLRPGERLISRPPHWIERTTPGEDHRVEGDDDPVRDRAWMKPLVPVIERALEKNGAIELSGGVDSRLVLALALHHGIRPPRAFTLGLPNDEDATIARTICREFGIRHIVRPAQVLPESAAADGLAFVRAGGFGLNACSYAWMPATFRNLNRYRDTQIGGGGGECATGFYYSPFDRLCASPEMQNQWINLRLFVPGVSLRRVFGRDAGRALQANVHRSVHNLLQTMPGTWRERTDLLYLRHRIPNTTGPLLAASGNWYQPVHPLLHRAHLDWARRVPVALRADRRCQMQLIHDLAPRLAAIPYSGARTFAPEQATHSPRMTPLRVTLKKIIRRVRRQPRVPDLGAAGSARSLARSESVEIALARLAQLDNTGDLAHALNRILDAPDRHAHVLGALVTAAWAHESLLDTTKMLSRPEQNTDRRRAA